MAHEKPPIQEKPPAFQFYPKDWLLDDKVQAMSLAQRGLYITLLSFEWLNGAIPADKRQLSDVISVPFRQLNRLWKGAIVRSFRPRNDGNLVNPRLERERQKQAFFRA